MKRRYLLLLVLLTAASTALAVLLSESALRQSIERLTLERARYRLSLITWGFGLTSKDVDIYSYIHFPTEVLAVRKDGIPVFQYGTARLDLDSPSIRSLGARVGSYDFTLYMDFGAATAAYGRLVGTASRITAAVFGLLFGICGWALVCMIADPVSRLAREMVAITSRNLRQRVRVPRRKDEVRQLIVTFNAMLDEISGTYERQARFVEDITHDLVTPVQTLEGYRQLIERHGREPALLNEYLGVLRVELRRLRDMTASLKAATAAEKRRRLEQVDASRLTERIVQYYRELFPAIRFDAEVQAGVSLGIDPLDLERIENILIDNAVKYGGDGGAVDIRLGGGEFSVRDFGEGIPAEEAPLVFERYRRGPNAERRGTGSGIGLAILKRLAEEYGFRILLETGPGRGCAFTLVFAGGRAEGPPLTILAPPAQNSMSSAER